MLKQVAQDVYVHQSDLLKNNTVVVQGAAGVLLIDPGITAGEMTCIARDLGKLGKPVVAGFSTHPDWDHVLWHPDFGDAPRYGTAPAADFMKHLLAKENWRAEVAKGLPEEIANDVPLDLFGRITALPAGVIYIPWDGPKVRVLEHAAHTQGHAALYIEERGVFAAGDMLSDIFTPMLNFGAADPIGDYLAALELFDSVADKVTAVIPGHGTVATGDQVRARIKLDRAYVQALRDGRDPADPRITSPAKGWEWVAGIHEWHVKQIAQNKSKT